MSAPARDPEVAAKRLFRRLLRLLPSDFRGDYGREMYLGFRDQLAAAEPRARRRVLRRTAAGLIATAVREHWDVLRQDLRGSWRSWRRAPGAALVALLTLGLGAGLATTIFAVTDGVLLRPLPYPEPEGLVRIHDTNPTKGIREIGGTSGNVADWRRRIPELALAGSVLGVAVAVAASEVVRGLLFEVAPTDPAVFAGVLIGVVALAVAAAGLPALRASAIEPREALR